MKIAIGVLGLVAAACPGRQSGGTTPPRPEPVCAKDKPCENLDLEACSPELAPRPLAELFASGDSWSGQEVSVAGPLRQGPTMCTLMACGPERPCCNRCSATLVLADEPPAGSPLGDSRSLRILGENIGCAGDDTGVCCAYDPEGQPAVATGTLAVSGDAQEGFAYALENSQLCAP